MESKKKEPAKDKYLLSELRKNCVTVFGVTTSTFDGAMYGKDGMYSIEETKKIIKTWREEKLK